MPNPRPTFTITLDQLKANTLVGMALRSGAAGADDHRERQRNGQIAQGTCAALDGEVATGAALAIASFDMR